MSEEKTEEATPKKLDKAAEKGNVPRSRHFGGYIALLTLVGFGGAIFHEMDTSTERMYNLLVLSLKECNTLSIELCFGISVYSVYEKTLILVYRIGLLFMVGSLIGSISVGGVPLALNKVAPNLQALNPVSYFTRTFGKGGRQKAITLLLIASGFIGFSAYELNLMIYSSSERIVLNPNIALVDAVLDYLSRTSVPLFVLWMGLVVVFDSERQIEVFKSEQKMTQDEVKQERKGEQQAPEIKTSRDQISREDSRYSLNETNLIITSSSRCVLLVYDPENAPVPVVLLKCAPNQLRTLPIDMKSIAGSMFYDTALAERLDGSIGVGKPITKEFYEDAVNYLNKRS